MSGGNGNDSGAVEACPPGPARASLASYVQAVPSTEVTMQLRIVVHETEEGGYWAEVPSIAGCASQGDTRDDLLRNLSEAVRGCLSADGISVELVE